MRSVVKYLLLLSLTLLPLAAQPIYNSIPSPLPGSVPSLGPEAYAFQQLGDGLVFAPGTPRQVADIQVVMDSWACQQGHWYNGVGTTDVCNTTPGATFSQPITLNIYAVVAGTPPEPGALIATTTQTFQIPYRPSSDAVHCGAGTQEWYDPTDMTCHYGLADVVVFNLASLGLTLPDQVIVGIEFNTTHYGPMPLGMGTACYMNDNNCPYDSLNIGVLGNPTVGSNTYPTGVYANWSNAAYSCTSPPTGVFTSDSGDCANPNSPPNGPSMGTWNNQHLEIEVDPVGPDTFQVTYSPNLNVGDSFVNVSNTGASGGNICVSLYAFDPAEELVGCCACALTPNALKSLSVRTSISGNALTPGTPTSLTIKLLASAQGTGTCDAATAGTSNVLTTGMAAWGTKIHATPTGAYRTTETPFSYATLSSAELNQLVDLCGFIESVGSGYGICAGCTSGGI